MRLNEAEIQAIKDAVQRRFGEAARVYVFGSRIREEARGGDIDLLVEAPSATTMADRERARLATMADIQFALGDQKIDIVVTDLRTDSNCGDSDSRPIVAMARSEGVPL